MPDRSDVFAPYFTRDWRHILLKRRRGLVWMFKRKPNVFWRCCWIPRQKPLRRDPVTDALRRLGRRW